MFSISKRMWFVGVLVALVLAYWFFRVFFPPKTYQDLVFDNDETPELVAEGIKAISYVSPNRSRAYPDASIWQTSKRIVILQKTMASNEKVVIGVLVNSENPPQQWKGVSIWGNIGIQEYTAQNIITQDSPSDAGAKNRKITIPTKGNNVIQWQWEQTMP
jgi:hypothetical protein